MKLTYTQPRKRVSEYVAVVGDLYIEVDKVATDYLGWQVFISRLLDRDAEGNPETRGSRDAGIYHTFAQTRREAYDLAAAFAEADLILTAAFA
ncbi:hypothetical protein SEA_SERENDIPITOUS_85 [Mycobacterium phage Serendipitous]|uniref:Uncharacterized protein n=1 Tax=Mycobacterium phage Serendipitous TaxID=2301619 RepID=A0A385UHH8_9CAUD|nr:hypothetical protein I5G64_gp85 [Mycobacterium phage Serendipitous]AYB70626.1 hypothetical protein SEA_SERENDIPITOUS_85 [Mycobacterium phage Serendipitous]